MQARIWEDGHLRATTNLDDVKAAHAAGLTLWVDLEKQTPEIDEMLSGTFGLHPLTIEDLWMDRASPKLDQFDHYLYILVHGVQHGTGPMDLALLELDLILGPTFLLSHDSSRCVSADVRAELDRSPRVLAKGPAWLAHALLDHLVDRYMPLLDEFDAQIETLETEVLDKAGTPEGRPVLAQILSFKRSLQSLRRIAIHQREVLLRLSRGEFDVVPPLAVPFYRDIYDHFVRINDLAESYRELVTSALEAYLSVQSNRMNEIMKTLTTISTVMLPLTFIAGVYGMNFKTMPELEWRFGYPYALTLMAVVAIGILWFFKRKRWV